MARLYSLGGMNQSVMGAYNAPSLRAILVRGPYFYCFAATEHASDGEGECDISCLAGSTHLLCTQTAIAMALE